MYFIDFICILNDDLCKFDLFKKTKISSVNNKQNKVFAPTSTLLKT